MALEGTVEKLTDFSGGYAVVKTKEENTQNYIINKDGGLDYGYCTLEGDGAKFNGGKAQVLFRNHETQDKFSLIDESGNLVFEPVTFGANIESVLISGNYILVLGEEELKTDDLSGKAIGAYKNSEISNFSDISFCDEVVILKKIRINSRGTAKYVVLL